jgi:hypothetical protein
VIAVVCSLGECRASPL